ALKRVDQVPTTPLPHSGAHRRGRTGRPAGTAPLSVPRCEVISVMGWSPRAVTVHLSPAVSYASGPFTRLRAVHPSPGRSPVSGPFTRLRAVHPAPGRSPASGPLARIVSGAAAAAAGPGAQALGPHDVGIAGIEGVEGVDDQGRLIRVPAGPGRPSWFLDPHPSHPTSPPTHDRLTAVRLRPEAWTPHLPRSRRR